MDFSKYFIKVLIGLAFLAFLVSQRKKLKIEYKFIRDIKKTLEAARRGNILSIIFLIAFTILGFIMLAMFLGIIYSFITVFIGL